MHVIACDEACRPACGRDLQKWLVAHVRQGIGQWSGGHDGSTVLHVVEKGGDSVLAELELGAAQNLVVFGQDAGIEAQREIAGGNHAHDLGARPEWRQQTRDQDIGIQDDLHRDCVLRTASKLMQQALRTSDMLFRFGGEEFVILLPATDIAGAEIVAERIRNSLEQHVTQCDGHTLRVTASIGASQLEEGDNQHLLFDKTDKAVYRAKALGRNQVMRYEG